MLYGFGIDDVPTPKETRKWYQDGSSKLLWIDPIYSHWKLMLRRVFQDKGYESTRLQKDWQYFSIYREWFQSQPYSQAHKVVVDKDLLSKGKPTYSCLTCLVVPEKCNLAIITERAKTSTLPIGVYWDKVRGNYQGYYKHPNEKRKVRRFNTAREAHRFWQMGKLEALHNLLNEEDLLQYNPTLKIGLSETMIDLSRAYLQDKVTKSLKGYDIRNYTEGEKYVA